MSSQSALFSRNSGVGISRAGNPLVGPLPAGAAERLLISIQNSRGITVRTVTMGAFLDGEGSRAWESTDNITEELPSGIYSFSVNAVVDG